MWYEGQIGTPTSTTIYKYYAKVYETGSEHGINQGRVSKLTVRRTGETEDLYNWDRGLDRPPVNDEVEAILNIILTKFS